VREIRTLGSVRGEGHRHYGEPKRARSWKRRIQPRGYLQAPMVPRLLGKEPLRLSAPSCPLRTIIKACCLNSSSYFPRAGFVCCANKLEPLFFIVVLLIV
jgi:hypothetical protein